MEEEWDYRSVVGKLNFLEKSTRCDLSYSVHQCARFGSDPKQSHAEAVKRIGRYLVKTKDKALILDPTGHVFDCFVDADFPSFDRDSKEMEIDPSSAKSRAGYQVLYGGCPMVWSSKLIKEVCLSTTEAEYAAMSEALKDVKFILQLMDESRERMQWTVANDKPTIGCKSFKDDVSDLVDDQSKAHCRVWEDNSGAYEMARLPKMRPRTRHLNVKLHHFREEVRLNRISIHKVSTEQQLADIATKAQPQALFEAQRESLMQWESEYLTREQLDQPLNHLRACDIVKLYLGQPASKQASTVV